MNLSPEQIFIGTALFGGLSLVFLLVLMFVIELCRLAEKRRVSK